MRETGAEVVLFGATYPLAMLGPRLAKAGVPYLSAAHGFEYWLSIAPGTHAAMRYATSRADRVPVMCSAFIARTVRTAVPRRVPVSVLYPGADLDGLPPRPRDRRPPRAPRARRPPGRRLREPAGRPQGSGRVDPGHGTPSAPACPGRRCVIVGGGPYEATLRALAADAPAGSVVFTGQVSEERPASLLRARRRVRDAVSHAPGRARGGGLGQRVHRGGRVRQAGGRRAIRAAPARRSSTARPARSSTAATCGRVAEAVADAARRPRSRPSDGRRGPGAGRARTHMARDRPHARALAAAGGGLSELRPSRGPAGGTLARCRPDQGPARIAAAPTAARSRAPTRSGAGSASAPSRSPSPSPSPAGPEPATAACRRRRRARRGRTGRSRRSRAPSGRAPPAATRTRSSSTRVPCAAPRSRPSCARTTPRLRSTRPTP